MKTQEQVLDAVKNGRKSACEMIDSRDYSRLIDFFPYNQWEFFGFKIDDEYAKTFVPKEFTYENIVSQLKTDVAFGFKKALDRRGISSSLMYEVIKMWLWVLDDDLQEMEEYRMYGLPLFKAVALKYGFENPIGNDSGSENSYNEDEY